MKLVSRVKALMYRNILFQIRTAKLVEIDGVRKAICVLCNVQRVTISNTFADRYKIDTKIKVSNKHLYAINI